MPKVCNDNAPTVACRYAVKQLSWLVEKSSGVASDKYMREVRLVSCNVLGPRAPQYQSWCHVGHLSNEIIYPIILLLPSLQLQQKILECDRKGPRNTSIPLGEALQLLSLVLQTWCLQL